MATHTTLPAPAAAAALVDAAASGDHAAYAELLAALAAPVHGTFARIVRNDQAAGEMTATLFHDVRSGALTRSHPCGVSWLLAQAHERAVTRRRTTAGTMAATPSWIDRRVSGQADYAVHRSHFSARIVDRFDETDARLLALTWLDGHTVVEASAALGLHHHRVAKALTAALVQLGGEVTDHGGPTGVRTVHDLVGAYSIDALDALSTERFEEHLPDCLECQLDVLRLRYAARLLAEDVAQQPPIEVLDAALAVPEAEITPWEPAVPRQRKLPRLRRP